MVSQPPIGVRWTSIRYRTLIFYAFVLACGIGALVFLARPSLWNASQTRIGNALDWLATEALTVAGNPSGVAERGAAPAQFLNIQGDVEVRKVGWETFRPAGIDLPLDPGDTIETAGSGWAQIHFADGTEYSMSPSSLIVIEESSVRHNVSRVAVNVSSGVVDLSTSPTLSAGSQSSVRFANSTAQLMPAAEAKVNADLKSGSVTLMAGQANVKRGNESVELHPFQQVSVATGTPLKVTAVPPSPHLLSPANLLRVVVPPDGLDFRWQPVAGIHRYHFKISRTPFFDQLWFDDIVVGNEVRVKAIPGGIFYWTAISVDPGGDESDYSENFKFTVPSSKTAPDATLVLDSVNAIGHVILIEGSTDPGNAVFVNGDRVALVAPDGTFKYITQPFADPGDYTLTVEARNAEGKTTIHRVQATIR
jgi:hypothetical protein